MSSASIPAARKRSRHHSWAAALVMLIATATNAYAADTTAPSVPTNLVATMTSSYEVILTWDPSVDDVGVTGYYVYEDDNWQVPLAKVTETSFRRINLTAGSDHSYRVSAFDTVPNHSKWTDDGVPSTVTVHMPAKDTQDPTVPGNLVATPVSATQINLSWSPATDNVRVSGYVVYQNDQPIADTVSTSFQHAGLTPNTSYSYRVSAFDGLPSDAFIYESWNTHNDGDWTAAVTATTPASDTEDPSVPANLTVTAVSATQINVSWNAATDNRGVAGYIVYVNGDYTHPFINTPSTSFQHTGLTPGTSYNYRVSAYDWTENHGDWTDAVADTTFASDGFTSTATFSSSMDEIANPERGVAAMGSEGLSDLWKEMAVDQANFGHPVPGANYSLRVLTYRQMLPASGALDQTLLYDLNKYANMHRIFGTKFSIAFQYDKEGGEDIRPDMTTILGHIAQLEGFFKANADVIVAVHAGFLGVYGEWAFWQSGPEPSASEKIAVRDALYTSVARQTPIAFRTMSDLQGWYNTALIGQQAFYYFDNQARAGTHNDCYMNNDDDLGTYWKPYPADNSRALTNQLRAYHAAISEWTSTGGERCEYTVYDQSINPPTSPLCTYGLEDGARYHWRYLRNDWLEQGGSFLNNVWEGLGCYDEIKRQLGYRLQLDSISHPATVSRSTTATVAVDLRNVGWGRILTPRQLVVTLRNRSDGSLISGAAGDMRLLPSQATAATRVVVQVAIPANATTGDYDVYLSMPDVGPGTKANPMFAVRFANAQNSGSGQGWDSAKARFKAGTTLTVQ